MKKTYYPERGDLIRTNLDPTLGHEQRGTRPAVVLSPRRFNVRTGIMACCPISSSMKGYEFEVPICEEGVNGVIQTDQMRTIDWHSRRAQYLGKIS